MLGAGAVVPGPGEALESVAEVSTVQVMVAQVVMATPAGRRGAGDVLLFQFSRRPPLRPKQNGLNRWEGHTRSYYK